MAEYIDCSTIDEPKDVIIPPKDPASGGLPSGGTTGQVLTKASDDDGDAVWASGGGGGTPVIVDTAMSTTSTNPVQNKVITAELNKKVDKETGKGLSANDYTDVDKALVDSINNKQDKLTAGSNITISGNTISATSDPVTVDSALSGTSENPVQNKVIKDEIDALNIGLSSSAAAINSLDTRVQVLEEAGEGIEYSLDGSYSSNGTLTLSLTDGTDMQTTAITDMDDLYIKEVGVSGTYNMTPLTSDAAPVSIDFTITEEEAVKWRIMGLGKFELKDSGGNRVYAVHVAVFSMNGQKTLRTYWKVCGTSNKTVTKGSAVLICVRR